MAVLDDLKTFAHKLIDAIGFHPDRAAELHASVDAVGAPEPEPVPEPLPEPDPEIVTREPDPDPFGTETAPGV